MRRIQRDLRHEDLVKRLTTGDAAIFREIWRLLLFCAAAGVKDGRRRTLDKVDSGKSMPETYFSSPGWRGFLYLIGVAEIDGSDCLKNTSEQQDFLVTLFEEYANQGLYLLGERMQSSVSPLDDLVGMLLDVTTGQAERPDVEDLI